MTLCKTCGTVYDEFYGVCPRCGTPCEEASEPSGSLPPLGGSAPSPHTAAPDSLPPIDIAIQNTGDSSDLPDGMASEPSVSAIPTIDPDATIPVRHTIDPDATIPVQHTIDPDATIPVQRTFDPDATVPVQHTIDPDATIPVQHIIDPDATVPVQHTIDPDATIPVQHTIDPDATVPVQHTIDPDATVPVQRTPLSQAAPVNPISRTQEVPPIGNTNPVQYGDNYTTSPSTVITPSQPPQQNGSGAKIAVIVLIIVLLLAGCGVGTYFLFFHNKNTAPETSADTQTSQTSDSLPAPSTDPASLRAGARSMNMAVLNLYAGVTNGSVNAAAPSNELRGLSPDKLPRAGASEAEREEAAEALTIRDVVTYAQSSDRFNDITLPYYVYAGAQIYYKEDAAGTPLTFDTTLRQIMNAPSAEPVPSSAPESAPESSVQPSATSEPSAASEPSQLSEPSAASEPSETSAAPTPRERKAYAVLLTESVRELYEDVADGTLHRALPSGKRYGIPTTRLPSVMMSDSEKAAYADALTIMDAVRYGEMEDIFTADTIGDYVYRDGTIYVKEDANGTPLTADTTLGTIVVHENEPEPSQAQSSTEESSVPQSSADVSSRPESTVESSPANDPMMEQLAGKWEMTFNTDKYSEKELQEIRKDLNTEEFVILLNADGSCSSYLVKNGATEVLGSGQWTVNNTLVSVIIDGDEEQFSYRDGHLNTAAWGDIAYFAKK